MSSEPSLESTTLDILRAYSHPPSPSSPDATFPSRPPDCNSSPGSRCSGISGASCSPPSMLFTADKSLRPDETNESPFRWNLPPPSELPMGPEESKPLSGGTSGDEPGSRTHIWQGWRVVVFGSCECVTRTLPLSWRNLKAVGFNVLLLLIPVSVSGYLYTFASHSVH